MNGGTMKKPTLDEAVKLLYGWLDWDSDGDFEECERAKNKTRAFLRRARRKA